MTLQYITWSITCSEVVCTYRAIWGLCSFISFSAFPCLYSCSLHPLSHTKKNLIPLHCKSKYLHVNTCETLWAHRPEWAYGCVSRRLQVQGPWRELQFNPNEWGHYVSAYNIEKLCKWIRCYTTMLLLSKHKQHCTNGQMFTMLKYDEIRPRGGIHDYTYTHKGRLRWFTKSSSLQMYESWSAPMNAELQWN